MFIMAEAVRFELTVPCGTLVFKTRAINHSATLPYFWHRSKDLNPGHSVLETDALPAELHLHILVRNERVELPTTSV